MGRKPMGPWINMTPPIRGGVYRMPSTPTLDPEDLDAASCTSSAGRSLPPLDEGIDVLDRLDASPPAFRRRATNSGPSGTLGKRLSSPAPSTLTDLDSGYDGDSDGRASVVSDELDKTGLMTRPGRMCPTAYTELALHDNVEKDLRDYPSLDPTVQQGIVNRYRQLHQQVRDEGLYKCNYTGYAKEMVRYTILFALFATTMYHGWYYTSAVFLGLFWVRVLVPAAPAASRALLTDMSSTKSCSPPTMLDIGPSPRTLSWTHSLACSLPTFAAGCLSAGGRAATTCTT